MSPSEIASSKAGRHRLYSNEQRKDRNRQAQAAFRDRRSKYQKTLEEAMLKYEDTIESLKQDNHISIQRAESAEQRCAVLDSEVANLQKLLQMALAENQRLLSNNIASPNSPSFSVPEVNSPPTSLVNSDLMFASLDDTQASQDMFDATWLHLNQPTQTKDHKHQYVFTDCNLNEFCLDICL